MNTRVIWFPCTRGKHRKQVRNFLWEQMSSAHVWTRTVVSDLEDDVGPGGFCRQRQHVAPHGLSVETIPQVTSVRRHLQGARQTDEQK